MHRAPSTRPTAGPTVKILVLHNQFAGTRGGAEAYCGALSEALNEVHDVVVATAAPDPDAPFPQLKLFSLSRLLYRTAGLSRLSHVADLLDVVSAVVNLPAVRRLEPDVIHVHNWQQVGVPTIALLSRVAPVVHTVHDFAIVDPQCTAQFGGHTGRLLRAVMRWRTRGIGRLLAGVTLIWPAERTRSIAHGLGLARRPGDLVIPHGWPDPTGAPAGGSVDRATTLLYLGQLSPHKGVSVMLDAWRGAAGTARLRLGVAGSGRLRREAQSFAADDPRVRFHGFVTGSKKHDLLAESGWLVFPSTWPENFPIVIVEALQYGIPVICAAGAVPPMLEAERNCIVYTTTDELTALFSRIAGMDGDEYERFSVQARATADDFDWHQHLATLHEVYSGVIARG